MGHPDAEPKLIGRNIHVMLTPLPPNKRKPKFHVRRDENVPDEDEGGDEGAEASSSAPQS
jgi:translation initiation factor IF-3